MKKLKKCDTVVFRNLNLMEIAPLDEAIKSLQSRGMLSKDVEFLLVEGEVEQKALPALAAVQVQIKALNRPQFGMGSILCVSGIPPVWGPYLHRALRETGLMPPGSAMVCLPDGASSFEAMPKAKLIEILNRLIGEKK